MGQGMAMDSEARCEENQAQKYGTIYAFKTPWYEIETHISHNLNFGFVKLGLKKGADCKRNTEEEEFVLRLVVLVLFPTNLKFPWRPLSSILLAAGRNSKYA